MTNTDKVTNVKKFSKLNEVDPGFFDALLDVYYSSFKLKTECETREGFLDIMDKNGTDAFKTKYGAYSEHWVALINDKGDPVTGNNFGLIPNQFGTSVHEIYIFTNPEVRNRGLGTKVVAEGAKHAQELSKSMGKGDVLIRMNEQNYPGYMAAEQDLYDRTATGLRADDRLLWWGNPKSDVRGYKKVGFNYIQPPLEAGGEACFYLLLMGKLMTNKYGDNIPVDVVKAHLEGFGSKSVLKDRADNYNRYASVRYMVEQLDKIAASQPNTLVPLLPMENLDLAAITRGMDDNTIYQSKEITSVKQLRSLVEAGKYQALTK